MTAMVKRKHVEIFPCHSTRTLTYHKLVPGEVCESLQLHIFQTMAGTSAPQAESNSKTRDKRTSTFHFLTTCTASTWVFVFICLTFDDRPR